MISMPVAFVRNFKRPSTGDLVAGVSVACVGIPQSLAYAELAGLPPQYGLLALAVACLAAAPFVSSHYLQTGPVAITALLTFGVLSSVDESNAGTRFERAAFLAVLVGLIMMVLGVLRLGRAVYLLSEPVIAGFIVGAAVLIVAAQLPKTVDVDIESSSVIAGAISALTSFREWNWQALVLATATAVFMLVSKKIHKLLPDVLIAVIVGVALTHLGYSGGTVDTVEKVDIRFDVGLPWSATPELLIPAFAIALAGFAETASVVRRFAATDRIAWSADREVMSQGIANLASGVFGAFPVAGSISRSALNRTAGATSAWSGFVTGVLILAVLPVVFLIDNLPLAVLGAIVIVVVLRLVDLKTLIRPSIRSYPQAAVSFGTLASTVLMAPHVERGLLVGLVLAITVHLYRELNVTVATARDGTQLTIRPSGVLWFATVPQVERMMRETLALHRYIDSVVIDLASVGRVDYSGAVSLNQVLSDRIAPTVQVDVVGLPDNTSRAVRNELSKYVLNKG